MGVTEANPATIEIFHPRVSFILCQKGESNLDRAIKTDHVLVVNGIFLVQTEPRVLAVSLEDLEVDNKKKLEKGCFYEPLSTVIKAGLKEAHFRKEKVINLVNGPFELNYVRQLDLHYSQELSRDVDAEELFKEVTSKANSLKNEHPVATWIFPS
jgi:hypothetical protein